MDLKEKEIYRLTFGTGDDRIFYEVGLPYKQISEVVSIEMSPRYILRDGDIEKGCYIFYEQKKPPPVVYRTEKEYHIHLEDGRMIQVFPDEPIAVFWRDET